MGSFFSTLDGPEDPPKDEARHVAVHPLPAAPHPIRAPLAPGLHFDIPAEVYHADPCIEPSLSSSLAHKLVIETPRHAWFAHPRLNLGLEPKEPTPAMALGSVVHEMVLGRGGGIEIIDADDWRTKAAKEARDEATRSDKTAILLKTAVIAEAIRDAVLQALAETPDAADFMHPDARSEVVGIWRDIGGPLCRIMIDRLSPEGVVYDLKISGLGLDDLSLSRQLEDGYACRSAFYLRGLSQIAPEIAGKLKYRWIFAESSAPFAVRIVEADARAIELGDRQAALGIATWDRCLRLNQWPGWPRRVSRIGMGAWAESRITDREQSGTLIDHLPLALAGRTFQDAAE